VIGYRGVMAIVLNETPAASSHPAPTAPATPGFRVQQASAYALQFGHVYLNASPAKAGQRSRPPRPVGGLDPAPQWGRWSAAQPQSLLPRSRPMSFHSLAATGLPVAQHERPGVVPAGARWPAVPRDSRHRGPVLLVHRRDQPVRATRSPCCRDRGDPLHPEQRLYKLYDFRLPMPLPVGQIAVFAAVTVPCIEMP